MFDDSDDEICPSGTPTLEVEKKRKKIETDFAYLSSAAGKCKIFEAVCAVTIILNVIIADYKEEYYAIIFASTAGLSMLTSMLIFIFNFFKIINKYPSTDWNKAELIWNTLMFLVLTAVNFAFVYLLYQDYRMVKKIIAVKGILIITYVYDASLKFVTDNFDVDDPVYLMDQEKNDEIHSALKKRKWTD